MKDAEKYKTLKNLKQLTCVVKPKESSNELVQSKIEEVKTSMLNLQSDKEIIKVPKWLEKTVRSMVRQKVESTIIKLK